MNEEQTPAAPAAPAKAEPRPSSAQEWKSDLKWATVLLIAVIMVAPILANYARVAELSPEYRAWQETPAGTEDLPRMTDAIFGAYVVPFEILSVLLLAALIAGVVIAARDPERGA